MLDNCNVFHGYRSKLGEGLYFTSKTLFWLDISSKRLFKKNYLGRLYEYLLPEQASAIWKLEGCVVFLVGESGLCTFDLNSKKWETIVINPKSKLSMRGNDGGEFADGFIFGTMEKIPSGLQGSLYFTDGKVIDEVYTGIGIPNTFVKLNDTVMLISDSLVKKIYVYEFNILDKKVISRKEWLDLSAEKFTPDGGCISKAGAIFIAMWGGACVNEYDIEANLVRTYPLPVLQPTSCVLSYDERALFITSAREGLTGEELQDYPLSGAVLMIDLVV